MTTKPDYPALLISRLFYAGLPTPTREYLFHPVRRWRFDLAWPAIKVAVEIEGGTWINGGHTRALGYQKDCTKYNAAAELGWVVLRYTPAMLSKYTTVKQISKVVNAKITKPISINNVSGNSGSLR